MDRYYDNSTLQLGIIPPTAKNDNDLWFAFYKNKLLVKAVGDKIAIPEYSEIKESGIEIVRNHYLGKLGLQECYCAELAGDMPDEGCMSLSELRPLLEAIDYNVFMMAGRAVQIISWDLTHQYCGRCGTPTEIKIDERAKVCPKCGLLNYPRISPAIIVAVINNGKILLAHNKAFKEGLYSIIAGFVEPGETFEECLSREVYEEVSIRVKNIKYFGSQSWPFPNSMMVGFTAEYAGGEIAVDGVEIGNAGWFSPSDMPIIPTKGSISRQLIDWFMEQYGTKQ